MTKAVEVLDLAQANRLLLSYKRGLLTREVARKKLIEAGIDPFADQALDEADQTPLHVIEEMVGDPDARHEEVMVAVERCEACNGAGCGCAACGGRGFVARRVG